MSGTRGYRDLLVWEKSISLAEAVYELTRALPPDERFALTSQMRRAATSVAANIAEGQSRIHPREFVNHLSIARGSLGELDTLLVIGRRVGYIPQDPDGIDNAVIEVRRMLQGLIQHVRISIPKR